MAAGTLRYQLTTAWVEIDADMASCAGIIKYGYVDFVVAPTGVPSASNVNNVISLKQGDDFSFTPGSGNSVYARRQPQWTGVTEIQVAAV